MSGKVVSLSAFRERRGLEPLPPAVPDPAIAGIQEGVNVVTQFSGEPIEICPAMHEDYGFVPAPTSRDLYQAGEQGIADFRSGFGYVGRQAGSEATMPSSVPESCYGAYMAGKVVLPHLIDERPDRTAVFDSLVEKYMGLHPDESADEAVRAVIGRASATIALMQLARKLDTASQIMLMSAIDGHKFTEYEETGEHFFQRVSVEKTAAMIGLSVRARR